jgi:hypothetical protein
VAIAINATSGLRDHAPDDPSTLVADLSEHLAERGGESCAAPRLLPRDVREFVREERRGVHNGPVEARRDFRGPRFTERDGG